MAHAHDFADNDPDDGPTGHELAEIEAEWPLIEAELAVLEAEIHMLTVRGGPSPLDWRRLRRAEDRVTREAAAFAARHRPAQLRRAA